MLGVRSEGLGVSSGFLYGLGLFQIFFVFRYVSSEKPLGEDVFVFVDLGSF